jgi:hypothetical protein
MTIGKTVLSGLVYSVFLALPTNADSFDYNGALSARYTSSSKFLLDNGVDLGVVGSHTGGIGGGTTTGGGIVTPCPKVGSCQPGISNYLDQQMQSYDTGVNGETGPIIYLFGN